MKTVQHKRGTATLLAAVNPVIAAGEIVVETDTSRTKIGDGVRAWNALPYAQSPATNLFLWSNFR
jgi:hypothetical protein